MSDLPEARLVRGGDGVGGAAEGTPSAPVLRLAPRALPWRLVWRIWFGTTLGWFGWLFASVGLVFCLIFLPMSELWQADYDRTAIATITGVEATSASENDRTIYRARYAFVDEHGVARTGASYTTDRSLSGEHEVEYVAADPGTSRLVGLRARPFSAWVGVVLVFPLVGLSIALHQLVAGWRATRLLRLGVETRGRLRDKRPTLTRVNGQPVMALTFEYQVDGRTHRAVIKTLTPAVLEDDAEEPMLYDPFAPSRATTLDHLPGSPTVTPDGEIAARAGIALHVLLLPAVSALLIVALIAVFAAR